MSEHSSDTSSDGKSAGSDRFLSSLAVESDDLWRHHRLGAVATLGLPVWAGVTALMVAVALGGRALAQKLAVATIASAAAGRFIIWTGDAGDSSIGFSPTQLAILVFCLDAVWAVVLTWHAGVLFHVPWIGIRLKAAVHEGSLLVRKNRWMKRLTVIGVLGFVMLPVSSTGSIGGSLLGRMLGLSRAVTLTTVLAGSILGGYMMLAFAEALAPWFQHMSPSGRYSGIAVIVLVAYVMSRRYRQSLST